MTFTILLTIYFVAGAVGLLASGTNVKHAEYPGSPESPSSAHYYRWATVGFFGVAALSLLAASRTTDIANPNTTGIGSWCVCWLVSLAAAQAFSRAFINGIRLKRARERENSSVQLHTMLRGR